jgi:hypothetical protein
VEGRRGKLWVAGGQPLGIGKGIHEKVGLVGVGVGLVVTSARAS